MRLRILALVVSAGCITDPGEHYPVDAIAQLEPFRFDPPHVAGPVEFLGTGMPGDVADSGQRTVAAYRVEVSDDLPHGVAILSASSCIEPPVGPPDPVPSQFLGAIRDIGDETHFFTPASEAGDGTTDIDTETAIAYASRNDQNKRIVIVTEFVDGGSPLACGVLNWR